MPDGETTIIELLKLWFRYRVESEKKGHVLLACPRSPYADKVSEGLRARNLEVSSVESAGDGIEILESTGVDLVITWNTLEDLTGLDFVRFIKSRPYNPAIVFADDSKHFPQESKEREGENAGLPAAAIELQVDEYIFTEDTRPEEAASRAWRCWENAIVRRVREKMTLDLRTILLSSVPEGNTRLAKELEEKIASADRSLSPMKKVLLAESETETRNSLGSAMEKIGLEVEFASGGRSALMLMRDDPPNMVVVDPSQSDIEETLFLETAGKQSPGVEVVLLTENPTPALAREAYRLGVSDLIRKPIKDPQITAKRILLHLEAKRRDRAEELLIVELYKLALQHVGETEVSSMTEKLFAGIVPQKSQVPDEKPAAESTSHDDGKPIKLLSGEYEIVSADEAFVTERSRLPDLAALKYIDRIIFSRGKNGGSAGREEKTAGRRLLPRIEKSFLVKFQSSDSSRNTLGFNKDLSLGGMFISADPPLKRGEEVLLEIRIPLEDGIEKFSCQARVVWNTEDDQDKLEIFGPGFGVEFTVLDARASEIIRRTIAES